MIMSDTLTFATVEAAQAKDISAIAAVVEATETRVSRLAEKAARRMAFGGDRYMDYRDEFAQVARVAIWEALDRFSGDSVDSFFAFAYNTAEGALTDAVRSEKHGTSVDKDAIKTLTALLPAADGDVYAAEKLARALPAGKRLSPERAEAARLALQGSVSIDLTPSDDDDSLTIANLLIAPVEQPEEIRPKVGRGAAAEALDVLSRYVTTPRDSQARTALLSALEEVTSGTDVDAIESHVTLPRDPAVRRYVLDALSILRSYVSTATDGALAEDLRDISDERFAESAEKHHTVTGVLDSMGEMQRNVLRHSFGIGGVLDFGHGDESDNDGLGALLGTDAKKVKDARSKGYKAFAKRFVKVVSLTDEKRAAELETGAAETLVRGGRK
jgi:RNA polymerase sigma factor (sigma-70 family)